MDRRQVFAFKEGSGPIENLQIGARLILSEFYLTKNRLPRDRLGMIKRFDMYRHDSLLTSAQCCSSSLTKANQTIFSQYPELIEPVRIHTTICPQFSWALARMGLYFGRFFQKEQHSLNRPPVARTISILTGVNSKTVFKPINQMPNPPVDMPRCQKATRKVSKRMIWENVASKYETFIQEKIRRYIHQKYREQVPINLVELIEDVRNELADGPEKIEFKPSLSQMRLLLKGMGFRYEKIRGRPQIYESRDLGEARRKYLRKIRAYREADFEKSIWTRLGCGAE